MEAWVLGLLVDAHRVESEFSDDLDFFAVGVDGGRGEVAVGPVALFQDGADVVGVVVEQEVSAVDADGA